MLTFTGYVPDILMLLHCNLIITRLLLAALRSNAADYVLLRFILFFLFFYFFIHHLLVMYQTSWCYYTATSL